MLCKLCGSDKISVTYHGLIRDGGLGKYTKEPVDMYRCGECGVIWHEPSVNLGDFYESTQYRMTLEGTSDEDDFYRLHDAETLAKFGYTGTDIFRHKCVADIGCGGGAFLDFLVGVAEKIIAVEPSATYREILRRKGYDAFAYTEDALPEYREKADVIVSFDVIEHVEKPDVFLREVYELLSIGGKAFIGTPTAAPIMRELLGKVYEQKLLFSTQHLWVFDKTSLSMLAERAGFAADDVTVKYYQRYGLGNLLGWLRDKEPRSDIRADFITATLDNVYKNECAASGLADYIVLCCSKEL